MPKGVGEGGGGNGDGGGLEMVLEHEREEAEEFAHKGDVMESSTRTSMAAAALTVVQAKRRGRMGNHGGIYRVKRRERMCGGARLLERWTSIAHGGCRGVGRWCGSAPIAAREEGGWSLRHGHGEGARPSF